MTTIETVTEIVPSVRTLADYQRRFFGARLRAAGDTGPSLARMPLDALSTRAAAKGVVRLQVAPLEAHINAGRWVTPCACGAGIPLHPEWQWAGCVECGRYWTAVTFPDTGALEQLDAVLSQRPERPESAVPRRFYSWTPGETVPDLERQNRRIDATIAARARRRGR